MDKAQSLRNETAQRMSLKGYDYNETVCKLNKLNAFSNWDDYDFSHRPVNLSEIEYCLYGVAQYSVEL